MKIVRHDEIQGVPAVPGLVRRVLAYSDALMLVENVIVGGSPLPLHAHAHEQLTYIQSGELQFTCQGQTIVLRAGDSVAVPGNEPHEARALKDAVVLDIFTPARADFLK